MPLQQAVRLVSVYLVSRDRPVAHLGSATGHHKGATNHERLVYLFCCPWSWERSPTAAASQGRTIEFKRAQLRVEINSTDGDAGLQIDLDHEPWRSISVEDPNGRKILDVVNHGVLKGYRLTELFSESSEPPFDEFPLAEFQKLFPAGDYTFRGVTTDGVKMQSIVTLTHDFPAGPNVLSPAEDSTVAADGLVVEWQPVTMPTGIKIVSYQVLVISEDDPTKVLSRFRPGAGKQARGACRIPCDARQLQGRSVGNRTERESNPH